MSKIRVTLWLDGGGIRQEAVSRVEVTTGPDPVLVEFEDYLVTFTEPSKAILDQYEREGEPVPDREAS